MKKIYNWPASLVPSRSIVYAPQSVRNRVLSRGSFINTSPIAGTRNILKMEFDTRPCDLGPFYAWLLNNLNSAVFNLTAWDTPQLINTPEMIEFEQNNPRGIPFSTGEFFSTTRGWRFEPTGNATRAAESGTNELYVDTARWPNALQHGKVFGIEKSLYHIDEVRYQGSVAKLLIRPELRTEVKIGTRVSLRPKFLAEPVDFSSFIAMFDPAGNFVPGSIDMMEVVQYGV